MGDVYASVVRQIDWHNGLTRISKKWTVEQILSKPKSAQ
jgi:hypothetical protein